MRWRNPFDEAENEAYGRLTATVNLEPSKTVETFALDADINILVKRFGIHGVPVVPIDPSQFGDFSGAPDLREALEIMRNAQLSFQALPARIRKRFHNDPAELWDFVQDPENGSEALALGILEPREKALGAPESGDRPAPPRDAPGEAGKALEGS